eukprot:4734814-Amphidinium_carterae.1
MTRRQTAAPTRAVPEGRYSNVTLRGTIYFVTVYSNNDACCDGVRETANGSFILATATRFARKWVRRYFGVDPGPAITSKVHEMIRENNVQDGSKR